MANENYLDYNLGRLQYAPRTYKTVTDTDELIFDVFNGRFSVGVRKVGEYRPYWRTLIDAIRQRIILNRISKLIAKGPGTKDPILFSKWDKEAKKLVPEWRLELQKDEKMLYHLIVAWKGNTHDAIIRGAYGVAFGSENMSESDASFYGIDDFQSWLTTTVPLQLVLSNKRRDPNVPSDTAKAADGEETYF